MKLLTRKKLVASGFTIVETTVAATICVAVLAGFTMASVAFQRSFMAIEDYAKGQNDQMRISDYLSLDLRRAYTITFSGSCATPPLTVTMLVPNFYASADVPNDPKISPATAWPYVKNHHHNKHQDIILNYLVDYAPAANPAATTQTVTYVFDNGTNTLTRNVNGVATTIASDVKDFCVTFNNLDETAQTQITFQPRFRTVASPDAVTATTYYQTTLTRNTR